MSGGSCIAPMVLGEAWEPDEPDEEWIPHVHLQWLGQQPIEERDPLRLLSGCGSTASEGALVYPVSC